MKASIIKKMLTGALAASLVMAPMMSVSAASTTPSSTSPSVVEEVVVSSAPSTSNEDASSSPVVEVPTTSSVAGAKTSTAGVYLATSVKGSAVSTSVASIAEGYGLGKGEKPYAKFTNLDVKKSPLAKQAIDFAASSQGATVGPMVNIELGKMAGGKYSLLPSDGAEIKIALGIPKNFAKDGATFAMVCVRAGGVVSILEDVDDNPDTITFATTGGAGTYAIIRY